jgi:hypothetical protein
MKSAKEVEDKHLVAERSLQISIVDIYWGEREEQVVPVFLR